MTIWYRSVTAVSLVAILASCSDDVVDNESEDAADTGTAPDAEVPDTTPVQPSLAVPEFGTEATRSIAALASSADGLDRPRDLEFDPQMPENLWVFSQDNDGVVILFNAGTPEQETELFLDGFRDHFMEEVSSVSFGDNGDFGTCQETRNTYNNQAEPNDFMGPALWDSDLSVFAAVHQDPAGELLGSHIDMLHQSPLCMGIAHYRDNEYFVFDGLNGHVVYYDFQEDHGPGLDDHSDGIVYRFPEMELTRVPGVPGHMLYDETTNLLFVADTGGQRVLAYEVGSAVRGRDLVADNEPLADFAEFVDPEFEILVGEGLEEPSGLALVENRLFVGDHATGEIIAFDINTGEELGRIDTLADGLMGIEVAPDGRLWFVDGETSEVLVLTP